MSKSRAAVLAIVFSLGLFSVSSHAAPDPAEQEAAGFVISSGVSGGGYWNAASRLQAVGKQSGLDVEVLASTGSIENLERLLDVDSPVNLALAQTDVLQFFLEKHPQHRSEIETLENIGRECVFLITSANSEIRTDEDLQGKQNLRLGISSPTSGVAVTYDYMSYLVPEFSALEVEYGDTHTMMQEFGKAGSGADVVMAVHRPKERSPELDAALQDSERYRLVEINDERLTVRPDSGEQAFHAMNLTIPNGSDRVALDTICVKGLFLGNRKKLSSEQREKLADIINYQWIRIYATE